MGGKTNAVGTQSPALTTGIPEILAKRRKQLTFRLVIMGVMVVFFSRYGTLSQMAVWSAVYAALQFVELTFFPPDRIKNDARALAAIVLLTANSLVFGWPASVWGLHGGELGLVNSTYLLAGAVLNTVLTTRNCLPAFVASIWPFLLYCVITAVEAGGASHDAAATLTVALGGAMLGLSSISLWRDASATRRSELAAQASILQNEVQLRETARAAQAANRAKSDFLANMSHEIRTPLNGVIAMADMLAHAELLPRELEMAEVIRASGDTLQRLLSDILDMARIESGKLVVETAPFDLGEAVRTVTGLSALTCQEKGLDLVVEIAPGLDRPVLGDSVRVRQVLTNLLSNAVKFTEAGGVALQVQPTPDGRTRFLVSDTGLGFAMGDKARVLGRFEQADSSITRRFGGSGLGLSICSDLARLMGGELDCEAQPGQGARFWMDVPLPPASLPQVTAQKTSADLDGGALRVLMSYDHPTNRKVLEVMLSSSVATLTMV